MPKIDDYVQLAAQTAREISADGETWRSFLQTASTLYKYGFYDQMCIRDRTCRMDTALPQKRRGIMNSRRLGNRPLFLCLLKVKGGVR